MQKVNIRHDLDSQRVSETILEKISRYEDTLEKNIEEEKNIHLRYKIDVEKGRGEKWGNPRVDLESDLKRIRKIYNDFIEKEKTYFSKVRIIELPNNEEKRFILVYGDVDDKKVKSGTGPFESIEKAEAWFYNQGRWTKKRYSIFLSLKI